jgi:hypothetical protein
MPTGLATEPRRTDHEPRAIAPVVAKRSMLGLSHEHLCRRSRPRDPRHSETNPLVPRDKHLAKLSESAFPLWSQHFPEQSQLLGVDLATNSPGHQYRRLLEIIARTEPLRGRVITSHKLAPFEQCSDMFAQTEPSANTVGEVDAVRRTHPASLLALARHPLSCGATLAELQAIGAGRVAICLGTGGAAVAWSLH